MHIQNVISHYKSFLLMNHLLFFLFIFNQVFINTHDPRFPVIALFACRHIRAGEGNHLKPLFVCRYKFDWFFIEICWDYNYTVGCMPNIRIDCQCQASNCRGRLLWLKSFCNFVQIVKKPKDLYSCLFATILRYFISLCCKSWCFFFFSNIVSTSFFTFYKLFFSFAHYYMYIVWYKNFVIIIIISTMKKQKKKINSLNVLCFIC